jgi:ParB family chromosome partitioning protein
MEISLSYKRMMEELNYTQDQVAERMGKDRSTIANFIRLLKLPPDIQLAVRNGEISMGHARALINVDTIDKQLFIFNEIKEKGLSVRQTEALVRNLYKQNGSSSGGIKKSLKNQIPSAFQKIEDKLASHFSTRVMLKHSRGGNGQIIIEYYSQDELNKILGQMDIVFD